MTTPDKVGAALTGLTMLTGYVTYVATMLGHGPLAPWVLDGEEKDDDPSEG